jgi:hypothetical protein
MKGLNFVTNDKGERIALQIDLREPDKRLIEYLEYLEDMIDIELSKNDEFISWKEALKELKKEGIVD